MQRGSVKSHALFFTFGLALASAIALYLRFSPTPKEAAPQLVRLDAIEQIRNVLKLGIIETRISQIYDVRRDNLKIQEIPVPWTGQKTIIAVTGAGQVGYNLEAAKILANEVSKTVEVHLPEPEILSLDLDFHFVQEEDTFLRRLTPDDRNRILAEVKTAVRRDLLGQNLKSRLAKRTAELIADFAKAYGLTIAVNPTRT